MMEKLSHLLWRERELLEVLAYKLELEQLVLASGRSRWLTQANSDVEEVVATLAETEVQRADAADAVARELGLAPKPTLSQLIEVTEEPWRSILVEHREAFLAITTEIQSLSDSNKTLITAGYRSARETLLAIGGANTEQQYSPSGAAVDTAPRSRLVDRTL